MNITELEALWDKDSEIDRSKIDSESIGVSKLHNKYFKIARKEKTEYRRVLTNKTKTFKLLYDYYSSQLNADPVALAELGRPPMQKKLTKETIERNIETDYLYLDIIDIVNKQEEIIDYLGEIIKQINNRSFHLKNHLEFLKWSKGEG